MVSQWLTTVSRSSAVPRAGPSSHDLVGASDKCHRDRQAKKNAGGLELGDQLDWGVVLDELPELRHGRFAIDDVSRGRRASRRGGGRRGRVNDRAPVDL